MFGSSDARAVWLMVLVPALVHCGAASTELPDSPPTTDAIEADAQKSAAPAPARDPGPAVPAADAAATLPDAGPAVPAEPQQPASGASFACGQPGGAHTQPGGHDVWQVRGRGYRYYVPAGYDASRQYPVVVALHGMGSPGGGLSFADWFGLHDRVESAAIVVYPSASGDWNIGNPWDDISYLDEVLADLGGKMCLDESRTFGLGFSLGGWFAQRWACRRPDVLRGVAVTASGWPGEEQPAECGKVSTLVYGRDHDVTTGIDAVRWSREQNRAGLQCGGGAENPPWMLGGDQVPGCSSYSNCATGKSLVYCEDPTDISQGDPSWNHTFAAPYHTPVWRWFDSL